MANSIQQTCVLVLSLLCLSDSFRKKYNAVAPSSLEKRTPCTPPLVRCANDARYCCSVVPQPMPQVAHQQVNQQRPPVRHFVQQFPNGVNVEYQSSSQGWILAEVRNFYPVTGHYDLNVKPDVPWEKLRKPQALGNVPQVGGVAKQFQTGEDVEYFSSRGWMQAEVVHFHPTTGLYDLNIKIGVPTEKLRRLATKPLVAPPLYKEVNPLAVQHTKLAIKPNRSKWDTLLLDVLPHAPAKNPIQAIAKKEEEVQEHAYCQYAKPATCGSISDYNNGKGAILIWQNCPRLCAEYIAENAFDMPDSELRVIDCIKGGYTKANPQKHTWNPASGEYWETCVSHIDVSDAKEVFNQNPAENWYQAAMMILNKVYPVGGMMWEFQKEQYDTYHKMVMWDGVFKFMRISDLKQNVYWVNEQQDAIRSKQANPKFESLIQINTAVHENCHRHHSTVRGYRPLNTWEPFFETPSVPNTWDDPSQFHKIDDIDFIKEFPRRWEIYNDIPKWTREIGITETYFPDHDAEGPVKDRCGDSEAGPTGCARIAGLLSEAECYIHGIAASLWTSALGRGFTPSSEVNTAMEGAVFPLAYWQHVHVLYLQHMKKNSAYSVVWNRLIGRHPEKNLPKVAKIFLAHYDRAGYLLSMSNWLGNFHEARTMQMMKLTKKKVAENDVISDLRAQFRG